jgi:hypothetical protein
MTRLSWKSGTSDTLEQFPLKDSVMAIADQSFFDWEELPEAPSELKASASVNGAQLTWKLHGGHPESVVLERRTAADGKWQQISELSGDATAFVDRQNFVIPKCPAYRVCAKNKAGNSAYSNIVSVHK